MTGPAIPTRLRLLDPGLGADPDWSATQATPPDLVDLGGKYELVAVTATARDGDGNVVAGTVDLQPVAYWPKAVIDDGAGQQTDAGPLVEAGATDSAQPTGQPVLVDVRGVRQFTMRVAGLAGLGAATTLSLWWRVVR